jgi:hypothetical protein
MNFWSKQYSITFFFSTAIWLCAIAAFAQPNTTINLEKSKPKFYEERLLASEKTTDKKISASKKFYQNLVTHFNYYFNANSKLNDIINTAKAQHKDDYTQLLSFYNFDLQTTSKDKQSLDSIIYKCNAGILLHDLRSDWVDDLYLLLGKAYFLRKEFDSAALVFQYINYIYAPKDDGYDILLGSNTSNSKGVFSVATNEQRSLYKKITSKPPARNESFIWQARNYLEQDRVAEASGLISILRNDPFFPQRLQSDLHEIMAYSFYKQQSYDSAAWYLQRSLDNAIGKAEISRWEFLCGQLYQLSKNNELAIAMYDRAIKHNIDPFMDVYARLNIVSLSSVSKKENVLQENLNELYKLAKKEKFERYRDIIYYAAATLQLQNNKDSAAKTDLVKSIRYSVDNPKQKAKNFLLLADFYFDRKSFINASNQYDSVQTNYLTSAEKDRVELRRPALKNISENITTINRQDSLLRLAAMPEAERLEAVKKIYKQQRKAQGLKDADDNNFSSFNSNAATVSLFNNTSGTTEFYFSNASLKSQGYRDFKARWGNRPNSDNWRRESAVIKVANKTNQNLLISDVDQPANADQSKNNDAKDLSAQGLLANIPSTPKQIATAQLAIAKALQNDGEIFQNKLEEYYNAIEAYETLIKRFPEYEAKDQVLFNLAYCYKKMGRAAAFDSVKSVLNNAHSDSKWTEQINNSKSDSKTSAADKKYESVYTLFIEGKFEEAKKEKLNADREFGKQFWTPQLLFIESVYYIKQKQDSIAINRLQELSNQFNGTPLAIKAKTMIDVLKRRKEIETYLTELEIEKNTDSVTKRVDLQTTKVITAPPKEALKKDSLAKATPKEIKAAEIKNDIKPVIINNNIFSFIPTDAHYSVLIFDKVDPVFTSEARNAFNRYNQENFYNKKIDLISVVLDTQFNLLLIGPFANASEAVTYSDNISQNAKARIIPWLTKDKYKISIISEANVTLLKTNKDVSGYMKLIHQVFPDKF